MKFKILFLALICFCNISIGQQVNWRNLGNNNDANFYDIQKDFYEYWKDKTPRKGQGYNVFKRWEARMLPRVYPSGNMGTMNPLMENYATWARSNKITDRSTSGNWVEIGPMVKPSGYDAGVGRVDFIKFSPTKPNVAYVSTPDGGLWQTANLNDPLPVWTTYNDFLPVIGCSDLVIAPDGNTMYLATGSWEYDKNSIGIYKSTNGGQTWSPTSLQFNLDNFYKISRILMDPSNPLIMLASTPAGVYRTTDGWATHSLTNLGAGNSIHDLKFKPGNPSVVYASGKNSMSGIFWRSTDNGASWVNIPDGLPDNTEVTRVIMGVSIADPNALYVLAGNLDGGYQGLYKSTDEGLNFTAQSTSPNILNTDWPASDNTGQATHDMAIAVSPSNANLVNVGGINQVRSTDGGVTWNLLTYWFGEDPSNPGIGNPVAPYLHADVQSITYAPNSSTILYSTCDGSVSRSMDHGVTWHDISNNMRVAQQTDIALASDDAIMVTGLQDIGNLKNTGALVWNYIGGGDGESVFIDYTNNNNIVTSEPNGNHRLSVTGGGNIYLLGGNGIIPGTEFYSQISQDPVVSTTCYAGGRPKMYKCANFLSAVSGSHTWEEIGTPYGTGSVLRFVVAPSNTQVIYTIKQDAVSKTTDGGDNWADVTVDLPVGDAFPKNITVSNTNPDHVWVVFSGYHAISKVFRSTDGGSSWTNISDGLPNIPINTIKYRNNSNGEVYIGADIGVYVTNNSLSNVWQPFMNGLANCTVNDLEIYYPTGKIRAATYGRGSWESNLYTGPSTALIAAKVFLGGPYNNTFGTLNDQLRSEQIIPISDVYPALGLTQVNGEINGTNAAILIKDDTNDAVVDWIMVELRDKTNVNTKLYTRSALIQRDGDIVDMDGVSPLQFSNAPSDNYYVAIRHRNHLGFRTTNPISISGTAATLNFTDNSTPIYGVDPLKQLSMGVYGMYSGDANLDGEINAVDYNMHWRPNNSQIGYNAPDFNLDGEINAVDVNAHWRINNSRVQQLD